MGFAHVASRFGLAVVIRDAKTTLTQGGALVPACFSNGFSKIEKACRSPRGRCRAVNDVERKSLRGHGVANHYRSLV
jgi:hypothetical protein